MAGTRPAMTASDVAVPGPGSPFHSGRDDGEPELPTIKPALSRALDALKKGDSLTLASVPDGFDALAVADLARGLSASATGPAVLVHVARDGGRQQALQNALAFVAPEIEVLTFPAWD